MEACCSMKSLVGNSCGFDAKERKRQTQNVRIPFLSCTKNVSKQWSTLSFSRPQNEIDLVLSRAALFDLVEERIKSMTICPRHRATLRISCTYKRWRNKVQSSTGYFRTWKIKSSRQPWMLPQRIQPAGHERTSQKGHVTEKQAQSRTMSKDTWTLGVTLKLPAKWREPQSQAMVSRLWGQCYVIRLQCQGQSLLIAMVLVLLPTFYTATIDGIKVWQEYNIVEARFIKWSEFNLPRKVFTSQVMKVTEDNTSPKATFTKVKASQKSKSGKSRRFKRRGWRGGKATRTWEWIEDLTRNIIKKSGLVQLKMFDSHSLCKLTSSSKLTKFSCECCKTFATRMNWTPRQSLMARRKKPYIDLLFYLIGICTCQRWLLRFWRDHVLFNVVSRKKNLITNAFKKLSSRSVISIAIMHRFSNYGPISIAGQFTWS